VYLEKEFQQISETGLVGIEYDLDRFGVRAVIPIGGVLDVAARIAHPGGHYAREPPDELLHAPKTAASQNRAFSSPSHPYVSSLENNLTWFVSLALRGMIGSCVKQRAVRPRQKTVDAYPVPLC